MRLTEKEAAALGYGPKKPRKPPGLKLPDLPGHPGLAAITERQLQRDIRATGFRALPPGSKIPHYVNERRIGDVSGKDQKAYLGTLIGDGMEPGASDLLFLWDAALGKPGNRGMCWVECKRPVKPSPVSAAQVEWMHDMRALGIVAGWAQCWAHAQTLLIEAGAPLRFNESAENVPQWWDVLGSKPPLYGSRLGETRFSTGARLHASAASL